MFITKDLIEPAIELLGIVVAPIVGWLVKSALGLSKSLTQLELNVKAHKEDFEGFKDSRKDFPTRLTKVEDAIVRIDQSMAKSENQFAQIMEKLETLPRLSALVDTYQALFTNVVPRSEIEARMRGVEDRVNRVEEDVRGNRA